MISLSGLSAVPQGYQAAQARLFEIAQQKQQQDAMAAYGQALAALASQQGGGGIPGLTQAPPRPAAPPQMPQRPDFTANVNLAPLPGPTGNQDVDALTKAMIAKTGNAAPSTGGQIPSGFGPQGFGPQTAAPGAPAPSNPPAQVAAGGPAALPPQQAAQPQLKMPSTQGVQPGSLTWAAVVNAIKAANPKIAPNVLAAAVNNFLPLMQADEASKWKQIAEERLSKADAAKATDETLEIGDVVDRIMSGEFPPPGASGSSGRYPTSFNAAVSQELAKRGYNLTSHLADYNAMQKMIQAQNGPVAVRFIGAIDSADTFLDTFKKNIDQWNAANLPNFVNDGILKIRESNVIPDANAQKQAALIKSQYAELVNLLGSVFQSGGVPTDAARKLAAEQLNLGWSRGTLDAVIEQIQGLLADRKGAIRGVQPFTPGGGSSNAYMPTPAAKPTAQPAAPAAPAGPNEGDTGRGSDGKSYIFRNGSWTPLA